MDKTLVEESFEKTIPLLSVDTEEEWHCLTSPNTMEDSTVNSTLLLDFEKLCLDTPNRTGEEKNSDEFINEELFISFDKIIDDLVLENQNVTNILENSNTLIQESPLKEVTKNITNNTAVNENIECLIDISKSEDSVLVSENTNVSDKLALQEEENAKLRLQLAESQQVCSTLELQLQQKEEIIIKDLAESLQKDQANEVEIKQLKEKLEEKSLVCEIPKAKDLQELVKTVKTLKSQECKLINEITARKNDEQNYKKIIAEYEKTISAHLSKSQKLKKDQETVKRHLANLELAFSDVHQKYEQTKIIIDGYKNNEEALQQALLSLGHTAIKSEEKYESLKVYITTEIQHSNQELKIFQDQCYSDIHKCKATIKWLEIKNASLIHSLDQKTKECYALAKLCEEVTGKV